LLIFANPGTLNQICHFAPWISDPTVDGARVHRGPGRGRGPWVHRGPSPFKRKGTRSHPFARDLTALIKYMRRAAATTPEGGGARRELAGVSSGRRSRPFLRPRARAKRCGDVCALDSRLYRHDWASPAASTVRGRRGHSGELAGEALGAIGGEIGQGVLLTTRRR
jgi:hypothetical protein